MVCHLIFASCPVLYLQIKFLQQKHPYDLSQLCIFLVNKVLDSRMICPNDNFSTKQVSTKSINNKNDIEKFFFSYRIVQLSTIQSCARVGNDMKDFIFSLS